MKSPSAKDQRSTTVPCKQLKLNYKLHFWFAATSLFDLGDLLNIPLWMVHLRLKGSVVLFHSCFLCCVDIGVVRSHPRGTDAETGWARCWIDSVCETVAMMLLWCRRHIALYRDAVDGVLVKWSELLFFKFIRFVCFLWVYHEFSCSVLHGSRTLQSRVDLFIIMFSQRCLFSWCRVGQFGRCHVAMAVPTVWSGTRCLVTLALLLPCFKRRLIMWFILAG